MVGLYLVWHTLGMQYSYQSSDINGGRINPEFLKIVEAEHR